MSLRHAVAASLLLFVAGAGVEAHAQGGSLDAPMHPIDKSDGSPSRCAKCPAAAAQDLDAQRVVERTAPEYPGARDPSEDAIGPGAESGSALPVAGQLPVALPLR